MMKSLLRGELFIVISIENRELGATVASEELGSKPASGK
jgi:hypothetical protein